MTCYRTLRSTCSRSCVQLSHLERFIGIIIDATLETFVSPLEISEWQGVRCSVWGDRLRGPFTSDFHLMTV